MAFATLFYMEYSWCCRICEPLWAGGGEGGWAVSDLAEILYIDSAGVRVTGRLKGEGYRVWTWWEWERVGCAQIMRNSIRRNSSAIVEGQIRALNHSIRCPL